MKVIVKLFAGMAETYGKPSVEIELPPGGTVGDLRRRIVERIAVLSPLMSQTLFAADADYVGDDFPLSDGGEVACIPPVSGG